jgi:putative N-acetylmannosamine-6-phosphate epimerase
MINKGLIVSIQNYSQETTQDLAIKCQNAGAVAIRTDKKICLNVSIITLKKIPLKKYYITTTVEALKKCLWSDYIAIDSRKGNQDIELLYSFCHINDKKIIADVEDIYDVRDVLKLCVCKKINLPVYFSTTFSFLKTGNANIKLIEEIKRLTNVKIIAEGKIKTKKQIEKALEFGADNICIGTQISDIEQITKDYINYMGL